MHYQKISETEYQKTDGFLTTKLYLEQQEKIYINKGKKKKYTLQIIRRKITLNETCETICDFPENMLNSSFENHLKKYINKSQRRDYA